MNIRFSTYYQNNPSTAINVNFLDTFSFPDEMIELEKKYLYSLTCFVGLENGYVSPLLPNGNPLPIATIATRCTVTLRGANNTEDFEETPLSNLVLTPDGSIGRQPKKAILFPINGYVKFRDSYIRYLSTVAISLNGLNFLWMAQYDDER